MSGWLQNVFPGPAYVLAAWLLVMSLGLFLVMGLDKNAARRGAWRVPERRLFLLALLGGAIGGTLGMLAFRHKTKHWKFVLFFPALALLQAAALVWLALQ